MRKTKNFQSNLKPLHARGKFIAIYGAANLGKSVQVRELSARIIGFGLPVTTIKYPIYNLGRTGPLIDNILRRPNKLRKKYSEFEVQTLCAKNRRDFQPLLINLLNSGVTVVSEDYTATGIAIGMMRGLKFDELIEINKNLIEPDLSLVLDGERFVSAKESGHRNEDTNDEFWIKSREIFRELAQKFNWHTIKANNSIPEVHSQVWSLVYPILSLQKSSQFKLTNL